MTTGTEILREGAERSGEDDDTDNYYDGETSDTSAYNTYTSQISSTLLWVTLVRALETCRHGPGLVSSSNSRTDINPHYHQTHRSLLVRTLGQRM